VMVAHSRITQRIDRDGELTRTEAFGELASLISMAQAKGRLYCVKASMSKNS
jgi:hypothetical protein